MSAPKSDHPGALARLRPGDRLAWPAAIVILALFLLVPLLPGEFWTVVGTEILILGLFAMSFNLLYGYMGQISFGHAAFFGLGAYATAMLFTALKTPAGSTPGHPTVAKSKAIASRAAQPLLIPTSQGWPPFEVFLSHKRGKVSQAEKAVAGNSEGKVCFYYGITDLKGKKFEKNP